MARIWLIGMMGSGKTTVAPLVASRLGWGVLDTDDEISAASGCPIPELLRRDPAAFRAAEGAVVAAAAAAPEDLVVACGGGVVLALASVEVMRATGMVVLLDAPVAVLAGRVGTGDGRPLLDGEGAAGLEAILEDRIERYRGAAHAVVPAGGAAEEVAEAVVAAWRNWS